MFTATNGASIDIAVLISVFGVNSELMLVGAISGASEDADVSFKASVGTLINGKLVVVGMAALRVVVLR